MSLISTTTPLEIGDTYVSATVSIPRAISITGSVFADQDGTLFVEQSGDGTDFDVSSTFEIAANEGSGFDIPLLSPFFRIRFANTSGSAQTEFRIFADARDPYGLFVQGAGEPSEGGAWLVLFYDPTQSAYRISGRFNGADGYDANGQAAISTNKDGKYASFLVSQAVVSDETITASTEHLPDTF